MTADDHMARCLAMHGGVTESERVIIADLADLRELARKAAEGGKAAADELMTEFISKKRAANWGIINDGLLACDALLRALGARKEGEE